MLRFLILLVFTQLALADVSIEKKRLHKCYGLFVRRPVPENHPLWISVSQGTMSGTEACMEIINKANFDETGMMLNPQDDEGKRVLRSFSDMSLTFFINNNISALFTTDQNNNTSDVIDSMGAAHYFTRSVFDPTAEFSDVVRLDYALLAKRSGTAERKYSIVPKKYSHDKEFGIYLLKFWQGFFPTTTTVPEPNFFPLLVETGELLGFVRDEIPLSVTAGDHSKGAMYNAAGKNIKQHFGGGALGSQAYLLANINSSHYLTDGAIEVHRILGKNILEDFLCRTAPYARSSDVVSEVYPDSEIDFRKGISCMGCHIGQDNIAAVTRNLVIIGTNNLWRVNSRGIRFVTDPITAKLPSLPLPTHTKDVNFYKQQPSGKLFYRDYKGTLINMPVTNLASLGEAMAQTEDLYICAAKKYYKALTGINVNLDDPGNINTLKLTSEHQIQQQKVIQLGLKLKETQKIKDVLRDIISSPEFVTPATDED